MFDYYLTDGDVVEIEFENGDKSGITFMKKSGFEMKFKHKIALQKLKKWESVKIIYKKEDKNIRFHANIKSFELSNLTIFLVGEPIFNDGRNYLRIEDSLEIVYELIPFDKFDIYFNRLFHKSDQFFNIDKILSRRDPHFKIFQALNKKIDNLTELVTYLVAKLENQIEGIYSIKKVNISGGGISFNPSINFKVGDPIYVKIKIGTIPIEFIGVVIESQFSDNSPPYITVEFRLGGRNSKDTLIEYILKKDLQKVT